MKNPSPEEADQLQSRVEANKADRFGGALLYQDSTTNELWQREKIGAKWFLVDENKAKPVFDTMRLDGGAARTIFKAVANTEGRDRGMNKTERTYSQYLTALGATWLYEPLKFRLADLTYYSPDFMVIRASGEVVFIDTKAQWKGAKTFHSEDDAKVKIKVVAEQFPWFTFQVAWNKDGWQHKTY